MPTKAKRKPGMELYWFGPDDTPPPVTGIEIEAEALRQKLLQAILLGRPTDVDEVAICRKLLLMLSQATDENEQIRITWGLNCVRFIHLMV